jgi:hypothetical protein
LNQARLTHGLTQLVIAQALEERVSARCSNHLVDRLTLDGYGFHHYPQISGPLFAGSFPNLDCGFQAWHSLLRPRY